MQWHGKAYITGSYVVRISFSHIEELSRHVLANFNKNKSEIKKKKIATFFSKKKAVK